MGGKSRTVVWFRRDLRIEDNPALAAAARDGSVLPVYIWCPKEEAQFYPGRVSRWWLKQSLAHLDHSLRSLGAGLVFIKAESTLDALLHCVNAIGATAVAFNHLYDPISVVRDHNVKEKLVEIGISVQSYNGDLLYEPWEVYDRNGHAFTTFDAYWGKCLLLHTEPFLRLPPLQLVRSAGIIEHGSVDDLGLENEAEKSSNDLLGRAWFPGWSNADKALTEFTEQHLLDYSKNGVKVDGISSSLLSPYLHFGELSVRKVFQCVRMKQLVWRKEENFVGEQSVNLFLRSVGLREYSRYLCFNYPFTHERSLLSNLKYFPWNTDQDHFKAWRQGRTGYPLVDAGMRELWATGWIHNRIRVIVASFSVKFLLLPWRWGMKYFWDTLLDADLESDILGWQYISGSLPDGHELNRVDNPEVLGSKFDPEGNYVRHWLPELARMPTEWIHHPWDAPSTMLKAAGIELGLNYPKPIVDIDFARERLTVAIFKMWEIEAAARAANPNETIEEVVDNSEGIVSSDMAIPTVVLRESAPCTDTSSHDQRVPSFRQKGESSANKRPKCSEEENPFPNETHNSFNDETGTARIVDDLCSTAESCSAKKQTTSEKSFSIPHSCSSLLGGQSIPESGSSDVEPQQEGIGMEKDISKHEA